MSAPDCEILVVGSGAMGCLFAARLAETGAAVDILADWPEAVEAIRSYGVRVIGLDGVEKSFHVPAWMGPLECGGARPQLAGGVRQALVLVKAWQTGPAAQQLALCLAADGVALTLQNGLGNLETLAAALGAERSAAGVTTVGATLLGPGRVRQAGAGGVTLAAHPRLDRLAGWLAQAGFEVHEAADLRQAQWEKLVINAALNPLTALLELPNGALLEHPAARQLLAQAAGEAARVAQAGGIQLSFAADPPGAVEAVALSTAQNLSSMLQDVRRGAPTEIELINGALIRAAEALGVSAPLHQVLRMLVLAKVEAASGQRKNSIFNGV